MAHPSILAMTERNNAASGIRVPMDGRKSIKYRLKLNCLLQFNVSILCFSKKMWVKKVMKI